MGPAADAVVAVVFVLIGRHVHGHELTIGGIASTLWPFLSGEVAGWAGLAAARRGGLSLAAGAAVCLATVAVGMTLRVVAGQGTALPFVLVALGWFGGTMLGWRLAIRVLRRRAR